LGNKFNVYRKRIRRIGGLKHKIFIPAPNGCVITFYEIRKSLKASILTKTATLSKKWTPLNHHSLGGGGGGGALNCCRSAVSNSNVNNDNPNNSSANGNGDEGNGSSNGHVGYRCGMQNGSADHHNGNSHHHHHHHHHPQLNNHHLHHGDENGGGGGPGGGGHPNLPPPPNGSDYTNLLPRPVLSLVNGPNSSSAATSNNNSSLVQGSSSHNNSNGLASSAPVSSSTSVTSSLDMAKAHVIFMHKSAMQHHAREVHRGELKPHQCQQCLKSFSSNHQLIQHIRIHTGEKPYKCSYCDRRFKQLSHVQQHTRLHTGKSGEKPYKCSYCDRRFRQLSHVQQHTRLHTGERPYKCHMPECGRAFIQLSNLQQHLRNHDSQMERSKNRPFHCNICGKGFATETSLRTHTSKQHAALIGGQNSQSCPVCHKMFLGNEALLDHMRTTHKDPNSSGVKRKRGQRGKGRGRKKGGSGNDDAAATLTAAAAAAAAASLEQNAIAGTSNMAAAAAAAVVARASALMNSEHCLQGGLGLISGIHGGNSGSGGGAGGEGNQPTPQLMPAHTPLLYPLTAASSASRHHPLQLHHGKLGAGVPPFMLL
ncbi:hypothetical protein CHUAL_007128, partial [Chamberlinius hualienensis]